MLCLLRLLAFTVIDNKNTTKTEELKEKSAVEAEVPEEVEAEAEAAEAAAGGSSNSTRNSSRGHKEEEIEEGAAVDDNNTKEAKESPATKESGDANNRDDVIEAFANLELDREKEVTEVFDPLQVDCESGATAEQGEDHEGGDTTFTDEELFQVLNSLNHFGEPSSHSLVLEQHEQEKEDVAIRSSTTPTTTENTTTITADPIPLDLPPYHLVVDDHLDELGPTLLVDPYANQQEELPEIDFILDDDEENDNNDQQRNTNTNNYVPLSGEDLDQVFEDSSSPRPPSPPLGTEQQQQKQQQQQQKEDGEVVTPPATSEQNQPIPPAEDETEDLGVLELLDQLGDLALDFRGDNGSGEYQEQLDIIGGGGGENEDNDYIHPSLYCQPCNSSLFQESSGGPLPSIGEDKELDDEAQLGSNNYTSLSSSVFQLQQQQLLTLPASSLAALPVTDQDIDELLHLSSLSLEHSRLDMSEDLANNNQPGTAGALASHPAYDNDNSDTAAEQGQGQLQKATAASTVAALQATCKPILDTFGAKLYTVEQEEKKNDDHEDEDDNASKKKKKTIHSKERLGLGHRERIMGVDISPCGRFVATASQDSTARIWNAATNILVATISNKPDAASGSTSSGSNSEYECLRVTWASAGWGGDLISRDDGCEYAYLLATGNADGKVHVYATSDPTKSSFVRIRTLDHATFHHFQPSHDEKGDVDETDKPQVYALQFIDHWKALPSSNEDEKNSFLLTSSDDHIHLWDIDSQQMDEKIDLIEEDPRYHKHFGLREVMSIRFGDMHHSGCGVTICQVTDESGMELQSRQQQPHDPMMPNANNNNGYRFGGDRNPHNLVYVFDASYCGVNNLLGVALSDGSLRLLNGRGVCLTLLHLPGVQSHLTSFAWDKTGKKLATTVATGHVITWDIEYDGENFEKDLNRGNSARLHLLGQTSIRTSCRAVMQNGHDMGRPVFGATFVSCGESDDDDFLVTWGVDGRLVLWDARVTNEIFEPTSVLLHKKDYPIYAVSWGRGNKSSVIAVGGGGNEGGFVGIPLYLYDYCSPAENEEQAKKVAEAKPTTKAKLKDG